MPSWKIVAIVTGVAVLAMATLVFVGYSMTPVPKAAQDDALTQGTVVTYANGTTPIMRMGAKRESVAYEKIPPHVRDAVVAAEDREFYDSNLGFSPKGMLRAALKTATGGDVEGGSTITQQLARNYYKGLSQDRTMSRKFKEIFIASKLGQEEDKKKILEMYLNTIPFGRQSLGIQMASRSYFGKDVGKLSVSEAAMLAAMIQRPGYFQTQSTKGTSSPAHEALKYRWNYVLDGMVKMKKLDPAKRAAMTFPKTTDSWSDVKESSQSAYIRYRVMEELNIIDPKLADAVESVGGIKIETSLDPKIMAYATQAMREAGATSRSWPKNVDTSLIAVDSKTGEIQGFYAGNQKRSQYPTAFSNGAQVGSSFKPYVLATALRLGHSVKSTISGRSPMCFFSGAEPQTISRAACQARGGYAVANDAGDPPFTTIDLVKATEKSVNTSYVKLAQELGVAEVVKTAEMMGVPKENLKKFGEQVGVALGIANVSPMNQAAGYAAFANGGTTVTPHLITKITRRDPHTGRVSNVPLDWGKKKERVLTEDQAKQANYAMRSVVTTGTARQAQLSDGRQVAGKTGTAEKNSAAWFVGYIPQMSTAVSMYNKDGVKPITGVPGFQGNSIYGGTVPAKIWKSFMEKVIIHKKLEAKPFDPPLYTDTSAHQWDAPPPPKEKPDPKPSDTPSCTPSGQPGGNQSGQPTDPKCQETPDPTVPTTPSSPPTGEKPSCTSPGVPAGCDPNKPPTDPAELKRWCRWQFPKPAACKTTEPEEPNGGAE